MLKGRAKRYTAEARKKPPTERLCDKPGCDAYGEYRAPKSRAQDHHNREDAYYHFCMEHVREFNKSWNYFEGMSDEESFKYQTDAHYADRPTWPMGDRLASAMWNRHIKDPMGFTQGTKYEAETVEPEARRYTTEQRRAFANLDIQPTDDLHEIKVRYKSLVRQFHPDANGGDRKYESRLKLITEAYRILTASLA